MPRLVPVETGETAYFDAIINGKHVARWKVGSENLLPRIIDEAAKGG